MSTQPKLLRFSPSLRTRALAVRSLRRWRQSLSLARLAAPAAVRRPLAAFSLWQRAASTRQRLTRLPTELGQRRALLAGWQGLRGRLRSQRHTAELTELSRAAQRGCNRVHAALVRWRRRTGHLKYARLLEGLSSAQRCAAAWHAWLAHRRHARWSALMPARGDERRLHGIWARWLRHAASVAAREQLAERAELHGAARRLEAALGAWGELWRVGRALAAAAARCEAARRERRVASRLRPCVEAWVRWCEAAWRLEELKARCVARQAVRRVGPCWVAWVRRWRGARHVARQRARCEAAQLARRRRPLLEAWAARWREARALEAVGARGVAMRTRLRLPANIEAWRVAAEARRRWGGVRRRGVLAARLWAKRRTLERWARWAAHTAREARLRRRVARGVARRALRVWRDGGGSSRGSLGAGCHLRRAALARHARWRRLGRGWAAWAARAEAGAAVARRARSAVALVRRLRLRRGVLDLWREAMCGKAERRLTPQTRRRRRDAAWLDWKLDSRGWRKAQEAARRLRRLVRARRGGWAVRAWAKAAARPRRLAAAVAAAATRRLGVRGTGWAWAPWRAPPLLMAVHTWRAATIAPPPPPPLWHRNRTRPKPKPASAAAADAAAAAASDEPRSLSAHLPFTAELTMRAAAMRRRDAAAASASSPPPDGSSAALRLIVAALDADAAPRGAVEALFALWAATCAFRRALGRVVLRARRMARRAQCARGMRALAHGRRRRFRPSSPPPDVASSLGRPRGGHGGTPRLGAGSTPPTRVMAAVAKAAAARRDAGVATLGEERAIFLAAAARRRACDAVERICHTAPAVTFGARSGGGGSGGGAALAAQTPPPRLGRLDGPLADEMQRRGVGFGALASTPALSACDARHKAMRADNARRRARQEARNQRAAATERREAQREREAATTAALAARAAAAERASKARRGVMVART